jgi:hypothetical protein
MFDGGLPELADVGGCVVSLGKTPVDEINHFFQNRNISA